PVFVPLWPMAPCLAGRVPTSTTACLAGAGYSHQLGHRRHTLKNFLNRRLAQRAHAFLARGTHDVERCDLACDEAAQPLADRYDLKDAITAGIAGLAALQTAGPASNLAALKLFERDPERHRFFGRRRVLFGTVAAVHAHEALRDDADHSRQDQKVRDAEIEQTRDR